jgi:hypothetical protein
VSTDGVLGRRSAQPPVPGGGVVVAVVGSGDAVVDGLGVFDVVVWVRGGVRGVAVVTVCSLVAGADSDGAGGGVAAVEVGEDGTLRA